MTITTGSFDEHGIPQGSRNTLDDISDVDAEEVKEGDTISYAGGRWITIPGNEVMVSNTQPEDVGVELWVNPLEGDPGGGNGGGGGTDEVTISATTPSISTLELWVDTSATGTGVITDYVLKAGDVMTGPLSLPITTPIDPEHAATKAYVDSHSGGVTDHGALTGLSDPDHPIAAVQGLQDALDGKAPTGHTHAASAGSYLGVWNSSTTYPAGSTVYHQDGEWGTVGGAAAGVVPADPAGSIPIGSDVFASAALIQIPGDGVNASSPVFSNASYSLEASEPGTRYRSAWWKYSPLTAGSVQFDSIGSSGDTYLYLYSGPASGATFAGLAMLAADDESGGNSTSKITYGVAAGVTYYIQLESFSNTTMNYQLNLVGARRTAVAPSPWLRLSVDKVGGDARYSPISHAHAGVYDPAGTAASAVSAHAAAADPHTGYQKESEKGVANGYASLDGTGKVPTAQLPAAGGGGVTDHGDLTGLADDDHPQYHNDARGDARYVNISGDEMTGDLAITGYVKTSTPPGQDNGFIIQANYLGRWLIGRTGEAETGGNAGSNFIFGRYDDSGAWIDAPLSINRANGNVTARNALIATSIWLTDPVPGSGNNAASKQYVDTYQSEGLMVAASGWADYGSSYGGLYCTKHSGMVTLEGLFSRTGANVSVGGSNTVIGTIPTGFRPGHSIIFPVEVWVTPSTYTTIRGVVSSAGDVVLQAVPAVTIATGGWVSVVITYRQGN